MNQPISGSSEEINHLVDEARALVEATSDVAGEKIAEARKRVAAAIESGKALCGKVKQEAAQGAKMADHAVREYPYVALGLGVGVGILVGCLWSGRCSRSRD